MGQMNRPESDLSRYVYGPDGYKHGLLNRWGDIVTIDVFTNSVDRGYGWIITHRFNLAANTTKYLVFLASTPTVHPTFRKVSGVALSNNYTDLDIITYKDAVISNYGTEITDQVIYNANFNLDKSNILLKMWNQNSDVDVSSAIELPFSSTLITDRRLGNTEFVQGEYILPSNSSAALAFINNGDGEIEVIYTSHGYVAFAD